MASMDTVSDIDPRDLRQAFGRFGTGVTVITARAPDGTLAGLTVNSFNAVSLSPPIVLWSLSITSPSLELFRAAGHFGVNVLALDQLELSRQFSRPAEDKFVGIAFSDGWGGVPVLAGCTATLECTVVDEHVVGDHVLFLGRVVRYAYEDAQPLLFVKGKYTQGIDVMTAKSA